MAEKSFFEKVYEVVKTIPKGKVMTYGQIAMLCGNPHSSRIVGYALHVNPQQGIIPCHRVVFKNGSLTTGFAFGGVDVQRHLLESEGVEVDAENRVDLNKYLYTE